MAAEVRERSPLYAVETRYPEAPNDLAYHGLLGEIVHAVAPHTEADPVGILLTLISACGNIMGRNPHWQVSGSRHAFKVYPVLVGVTSQGRKGTAWSAVKAVLSIAAPLWTERNVASGLSSGEGLIYAVRDPLEKTTPIKEKGKVIGYETSIDDPGVEDKRLLVIEEEFSSLLKVMAREGNTLSSIIRETWDNGNLRSLVKNNPTRATDAHITIMGHITKEELLRYLDNTEAANGFANRFAWACVRRANVLPRGGRLDGPDIIALAERLGEALQEAAYLDEMQFDASAYAIWDEVYESLTDGGVGLLGAVVGRAAPQVVRIAGVHAAIAGSKTITGPHLLAALYLWDYLAESAQFIFGDALGDDVADTILQTLRASDEMTTNEIHDLFKRNISSARRERALAMLISAGKITRESRDTGGRPATIYRAA